MILWPLGRYLAFPPLRNCAYGLPGKFARVGEHLLVERDTTPDQLCSTNPMCLPKLVLVSMRSAGNSYPRMWRGSYRDAYFKWRSLTPYGFHFGCVINVKDLGSFVVAVACKECAA
jgi:hypothetical protein